MSIPPLTPEEEQSLLEQQWVASERWRQIESETLAENGLTRSGFATLLKLRDGAKRSGDLTNHARMTTGGMAKLLGRLEEDGFIERRRGDEPDARTVTVTITDTGRELISRTATELVDLYRQDITSAGISEDEFEIVRIVWRKWMSWELPEQP